MHFRKRHRTDHQRTITYHGLTTTERTSFYFGGKQTSTHFTFTLGVATVFSGYVALWQKAEWVSDWWSGPGGAVRRTDDRAVVLLMDLSLSRQSEIGYGWYGDQFTLDVCFEEIEIVLGSVRIIKL